MRQALVDALPMPYTPPAAVTAPRPVPQPVPAAQTGAQAGCCRRVQRQPRPAADAQAGAKASAHQSLPILRAVQQKECRFCVGCGRTFGPARPAILRVIEPVRAAWEMPVARSPMLLGRASEAEGYRPDFDMTFYDEGDYVSRRHARITKGRGGYFIADLGSSNGTTVNGFSLEPQRAYLLRNGDQIKVGLVVIQFRLK